MWEKHYGNIFETFGANLLVFSMASVKSRFTKLPVAAIFFKINRVPLLGNINDCTKFESKHSGLTAHTSF